MKTSKNKSKENTVMGKYTMYLYLCLGIYMFQFFMNVFTDYKYTKTLGRIGALAILGLLICSIIQSIIYIVKLVKKEI